MKRGTRVSWCALVFWAVFAAGLSACRSGKTSGGTCTASKDCTTGEVCVSGTCRPRSDEEGCTRDDQCEADEVCDIVNAECIPFDGNPPPDAGIAPQPDAGMIPTTCTDDQVCPAHQRCDVPSGMCVNGRRACTDDTPCAAIGQHCDVGKMLCVDCLEEAHCVAPMKCTEGECLDPSIDMSCNDDSACNPPMIICLSSMCTRGCATTNGLMCTGGNLCNEVTGHCEAPGSCTDDQSCGAPAGVCEMGTCLPGCGQVGGISCGTGTVCDNSTGRCVVVLGPCTTDANCTPPSTVCETGQCIPGCAEPGGVQCSGMTRCNPGTGRCDASGNFCGSDLDCNSPAEICNLANGNCDPGCATTGCTAPSTCNTTTGHCAGVTMCVSDGFEENDTLATARGIATGPISNLFACPGDDDYYSIALGLMDNLSIDLSYAFGEGDLDIELYNPAGVVVASGHTAASNESIMFVAPSAGTYVVRVYLLNDLGASPGNSYSMVVNRMGAPCGTDAYEENDTDTTGRMISPGMFSSLNVCTMDDDYYAVRVNAGDMISASVTFTNSEGDIDMRLMNQIGFPVSISSSTGNTESVSATANFGGTYLIRVNLFADAGAVQGNTYSMTLSVGAPMTPTCTSDQYEPNNSQAAQVALPLGSYSSLGVCTSDDDYYSLALNAGDNLNVSATFSTSEGDVDISLLNSAGTVVASSTGTTGTETFTYAVPSGGTYTLRIYLYGDSGSTPGNTYSVTIAR